MRGRRGNLCILLGLGLLLGAAGLTLYNINRETVAGEDSEAVMTELAAALTETPRHTAPPPTAAEAAEALAAEEEPEPLELDGRYYMGVITFPTLDLQLPVQHEWSYENLRVSPCRMTGSALTEDLVILAHNYRTHFGPINRLAVGDEVAVTLVDGTTYLYRVSVMEVVAPTAVEDVTSGEWPLTLFTCTLGGRTRLVVRCDWKE